MKPCIALLTGGYSGEAEVSYATAITIEKNIDREKYDCYKIDITRTDWCYEDENGQKTSVNKNDFSIILQNKKINFDAALISIHGTPGEDGKMQGYLDMIGVPYTSCNAATSAITFNKRYTIAVAGAAGINVSPSVLLFKKERNNADKIQALKKLNLPVFVKPNNGGSSIGMSKVSNSDHLMAAIDKAFNEDDQVLVEEFIPGREFTVGVYKKNNETIALPITEIISKNEFFDFEAKYKGASDEITPAKIDESLRILVQSEARKIYGIFNCEGVVRVDFIYNISKRKLFMLEVNTVPGQTEASLVPQQIRFAGGNLKDFYSALIEEALSKKER